MFTVAKIQLRLCCLIQLHTSQTYVTTVVLGSFPAALIILSPSVVILLFDFAVEHFFTRVSQVKATCFQLKWKQRSRKEVTACLINQLCNTTARNDITDRNVVLCSKLCQSGFVDALNDPQLSWLLSKYVCIKMMLGSLICASKFKSVRNRPVVVHYWEHCLTDCTPSCTLHTQTALPPLYTDCTPSCTLHTQTALPPAPYRQTALPPALYRHTASCNLHRLHSLLTLQAALPTKPYKLHSLLHFTHRLNSLLHFTQTSLPSAPYTHTHCIPSCTLQTPWASLLHFTHRPLPCAL